MNKAYLGIDIGSISTKGVIIDQNNIIIASSYIYTEGNPIEAVKKLLSILEKQIYNKNYKIVNIGTTGSARKLIGTMLNAKIIKNEITAHAIGNLSKHPSIKTIIEIGGQDSKIILIEDGIITDYAMNTLCAAGTGAFLSSQAKRLNIEITQLGPLALTSNHPVKLAARCTVFAESDLVHKAQIGHKKEDIMAGVCKSVALNYLNNVAKGKKLKSPIIFGGGVSKNIAVIKAFEELLNTNIIVDEAGHLMGALGVAILTKDLKEEINFDFNIKNNQFITKGTECEQCPNNCEIVTFYKNNTIIDSYGNKCEKGTKYVNI